jgi:hypothetical protein
VERLFEEANLRGAQPIRRIIQEQRAYERRLAAREGSPGQRQPSSGQSPTPSSSVAVLVPVRASRRSVAATATAPPA